MSEIEELARKLQEFADARNWQQFHTPKNLAMAIAGEAGELVAEFQWLTSEQSELKHLSEAALEAIRLEMADVFIYLIRLGTQLDIDLAQAVHDKIALNEDRFGRSEL